MKAEQNQNTLDEEGVKFNALKEAIVRADYSKKYYEWLDQTERIEQIHQDIKNHEAQAHSYEEKLHEINGHLEQA